MYKDKIKLHAKQEAYNKLCAKCDNKTLLPLRSVALDVTSLCNMTCPHCYAKTFMNKKMISLELLKKALDELYELGVFHYILQGGEAIFYKKRLDFILNNKCTKEIYYISNLKIYINNCIKDIESYIYNRILNIMIHD